jgi:PQQ-dependent dehydrogenase (methanol/ethanol family)
MNRRSTGFAAALACLFASTAMAQLPGFKPVTEEMLLKPDPADWLMINRTYDEQRFSPLDQINKGTVAQLRMAWSRGLPQGTQESTPIVHGGIMYLVAPGAGIEAVNATNGDLVWEYWRNYPKDMAQATRAATLARAKSIAIFEDMVYFAAPDGFIVALDAQTGKLRWEAKAHDYHDKTEHSGGLIVADGKVISNRTCEKRSGCFIAAHDARTGKELWKFYDTAGAGEPGGETWADMATDERVAASWGLPGSYDPVRKVTYWAIANPKPYTRLKRHGKPDAVSNTSPSELYSNSTVALDIATGKLVWYYQHLPADDWDADHIHERTLVHTKLAPDPKFLKWINPAIRSGEERDVVLAVAEAGTMFALDRDTGKFLWASPFPYDNENLNMNQIDVETGRTHINYDKVFKKDGDRNTVCYHNTRSWWSTAYYPAKNALYVPFQDACLDMTANQANPLGFGPRSSIVHPGIDENAYAGIMKIDIATGESKRILTQMAPGNGSALVTGGDLLFWGDLNRRFRAFDPEDGKVLWELPLGGMIMTSTVTYAVNGKQYVAVFTGDGQSGTAGPLGNTPKLKTVRGHNAVYAFALP